MSSAKDKKKTKSRPKAKPVAKSKPKARPAAKAKAKPRAKAPAPKAKARPAARPAKPAKLVKPAKAAVPAKPEKGAKPAPPAKGPKAAPPAKGAPARPAGAPATRPPSKKSSRRSPLFLRRGPDGQPLAPGDLLLPGGTQTLEEIQYLFRGVIATQKPVGEAGPQEVITKRPPGDPLAHKGDLDKQYLALQQRFATGAVDASAPNRPAPKKSFQGVIERAKQRRREIGAFLRGLDIGRIESSQMDSHGEDSLTKLMEWSARLEKIADEATEPAQADYGKFHGLFDNIESTSEALIVDVEKTLRRLGGRTRS
ncbi:MAG: hypothetical protein AB7O37_08270 [Vicinamibacteria bacterium]